MSEQTAPPKGWDKVKALFKSRKFWALIAALLATTGALLTQQIDVWQALQAAIAALAAYSTGVAIEDNGTNQRYPSQG